MTKKILSILTAMVIAIGSFSLIPTKASAAVQRVDRTGGRDDGIWLFPLDQGNFNSFTDWAGCLYGYCKLCGGNHAIDGSGDQYHTVAQFNGAGHNGVDIGAPYGANVMAAAAGTVRAASWNGSRGLTVIIEHPISGSNMSYFSYYQHLSSVDVSVGKSVSAGSVIGKVGNSGGDYGTHLHFGMVLAEKNCNIVDSLYSIECSNVLTKADGFSKRGIILTNPSVKSVFPQGYNGVIQHVAYHSGSISYTFDKSKVNIGSATSSVSTQSFDTVSNGTYFIYNRATDLALNLGWNNDANCENVHAYTYDTTNRGELMSITSCSSDGKTYKIRPIDAKRLVQMYGESPYNGVNVCIYDDLANSTQWWKFTKTGNGYAILIDCDTNYSLSSVSGDAVLTTYTGAGNQIWELIPYNPTYTVNYNANGGSGSMESETFSVGRNSNLAANKFTRSGYTFQGWAKSAGATAAEYSDKAVVADLAGGKTSVTLYAVWKADPVSTYTINYDGNGNTSGYMNSEKATCNTTVNLRKNSFKKFGYRFLGWSMNKNATTAQYTDGQSVKNLAQSGGTVTLYAVWEEIIVPQLSGLRSDLVTTNSVTLLWDKSTAEGYDIYKDDVWLCRTIGSTLTVTDLSPATTYTLCVMPYVEGANYSIGSSITVTTLSGLETIAGAAGAASLKDPSTPKSDTTTNTSNSSSDTQSSSRNEAAADKTSVSSGSSSAASSSSSANSGSQTTTSKPSGTTLSSSSANSGSQISTSKPSGSTSSGSSTITNNQTSASKTNAETSTPEIKTSEPAAASGNSNNRDNCENTSTASSDTENIQNANTGNTGESTAENTSQVSSDSNSIKTNNAAQTAGLGAVISSSVYALLHFLKKILGK